MVAAFAIAFSGQRSLEAERARDNAHEININCNRIRAGRIEGQKRAQALEQLKEAMMEFNAVTREVRSDKHSTSYDPHFVAAIDIITPRLESINVTPLPIPSC